jgi:signal transduction histidine kinase
MGAQPAYFLFSLKPVVTTPAQLVAVGIDFSDFEIGSPIFDYLLISHVEELVRRRLQAANDRLVSDARMSRLLQSILRDAYRTSDLHLLYRQSLAAVCDHLEWDIGHVFFVDEQVPHRLHSSDIWHFSSSSSRFDEFRRLTASLDWEKGGEFPSYAATSRVPVWIADYARNGDNARARAISDGQHSTAVSVPILVADRIIALVEFISVRPQPFTETAYGFFSLFGAQIGHAVAHHEAVLKEKEQLAALAYASKMATLGEIAAGVAHEINNPISTISLITQILKRSVSAGGVPREIIESQVPKIELCVERVAKIVSELRDFSRESSKDPMTRVSLRKIISETVDLCHARFLSQGIALHLPDVAPSLMIYCRASQISQVLINLLNNAYDAVLGCSERWVRLECREQDKYIEISVSDSGPGISDSIRDKIMKPFYTTKPPGHGTGLGLSISSNIATDHGGCLGLDTSAPYTRFILAIPNPPPES